MSIPSPSSLVPAPRYAMVAYTLVTHQLDRQVVFRDPILDRLVPFHSDPVAVMGMGEIDVVTAMKLQLALSHRVADDLVVAAAASGVSQLAVLYAGLNTLCYRRPYPTMRLFEVDVESTQRWKRQSLALAGVPIPATLTYVPLDSDDDITVARFEHTGYDFAASTLVVWVDSTQFLPTSTMSGTMDWIDQHRSRVELVCSYLAPPETMAPGTGSGLSLMADFMSKTTDPVVSFYRPEDVAEILRGYGFDSVEDLCWATMLDKHLPAGGVPADPLGAHLAHATRGAG